MGVLQFGECSVRKKREVFVSKCKVWKLKEPGIQRTFEARVGERLAKRSDGESGDDVEGVWGTLKKSMLDVADEVFGKTRRKQRHRETWWWNEKVAELVKEERCWDTICPCCCISKVIEDV